MGASGRYPVAGGQPEKVGIPMENIKNLAVHPDGRQLVFDAATEEPTHEIWAWRISYLADKRGGGQNNRRPRIRVCR